MLDGVVGVIYVTPQPLRDTMLLLFLPRMRQLSVNIRLWSLPYGYVIRLYGELPRCHDIDVMKS